ncbi:hypothetical protein N658DRAFT_80985 [Parathielavia hyrcaniae]|uniref:Uncharacterized protein n=1 Tax=Parathielavia hyrcaniae TaxID=113614 RepID=A0AAN6Q0A8_9PEZI|nr:hypothetical protein N658DRAFT_80985 [Parathielavia hyrcaniae]
MRIAVGVDKAKDVFHPWAFVFNPDPLRFPVRVQAAGLEALVVCAKEIPLQFVGRVVHGLTDFLVDVLQRGRVVSVDEADGTPSIGEQKRLWLASRLNGGKEHLKVAAVIRLSDPRVLRVDRVLLEHLGYHGNVFFGHVSHIVRALRDLTGVTEAEGRDGLDGCRDLLVKFRESRCSGGKFLEDLITHTGNELLVSGTLRELAKAKRPGVGLVIYVVVANVRQKRRSVQQKAAEVLGCNVSRFCQGIPSPIAGAVELEDQVEYCRRL